jgi:DNA-binding transcriptional MerR regulator
MRISDLSQASDVPVATIKYYLREQLLPEGRRTSATQAQYDETHLSRLRLIRALLGAGGLSVARAREVLAHIDQPPPSSHDLLGLAQSAITRPAGQVDLTRVQDLMRHWGWRVDVKDCDTQADLARALTALEDSGRDLPDGMLDRYAGGMFALAEEEVASVPSSSAAEAVRYVILGTVLIEPVLLALRRLAQQEASARRFSDAQHFEG